MQIDQNGNFMKSILNLIGVGAVATLVNPIQLVRIRMQTMSELVELGKLSNCYQGVFDCIKRVRCQEGIKALWKGNGAKLLRFYSSQTINFISKQLIRERAKKNISWRSNNSFLTNSISGMLGSWISLSILYPIQHARNCISNSVGPTNKSISSSIANTFKYGGLKALYIGSSISMVGVAVFRGTNFGIFDTFKNDKKGFKKWLLAYFSSFIAISLTYPSDTVRRRMICAQKRKVKYTNFFDCLKKIYRKEGISSFYRGGPVIFLQSVSSSCALFTYDRISNQVKRF